MNTFVIIDPWPDDDNSSVEMATSSIPCANMDVGNNCNFGSISFPLFWRIANLRQKIMTNVRINNIMTQVTYECCRYDAHLIGHDLSRHVIFFLSRLK